MNGKTTWKQSGSTIRIKQMMSSCLFGSGVVFVAVDVVGFLESMRGVRSVTSSIGSSIGSGATVDIVGGCGDGPEET